MGVLEERIGYRFRDSKLRDLVFAHRSFRHENPAGAEADNERLEFLGDALLGFIISRRLYERFPEGKEGDSSRLRSSLVSAHHLATKARALDLGSELCLGRGEERSGGREKESILADVYESLVAGVYLDGGMDEITAFIDREFRGDLDGLLSRTARRDHKSRLQELLHASGLSEPIYRVIEEAGPDHRKMFEVAVDVGGDELARGIGRSKKAAQQEAARHALASPSLGAPLGVRPES